MRELKQSEIGAVSGGTWGCWWSLWSWCAPKTTTTCPTPKKTTCAAPAPAPAPAPVPN